MWQASCVSSVLVAGMIGIMSVQASGQQMVAVAQVEPAVVSGQLSQQKANPMTSKVNVSFRDVTLETVLNDLRRQAGVEIAFSRTTVPVGRRVSVQANRVELAEAFRLVLQGTGTAARFVDGHVVISPAVAEEATALQGVIIGKVIHAKTKRPIAGVTVLLDQASKGVLTDQNGSFRLVSPVGERTIQFRAIGMIRQEQKIIVKDDITVTLDILLEPSASVLDEVTVTGTIVATERKAITTPITVITADDIERRGITRVEQLFRGEVPGLLAAETGSRVYSDSAGAMVGVQIYARGSSDTEGGPNSIKTFVDGIELLDASYIGAIDPASIERIEIITGPQAATIYGSGAMGGVMQIFTKKGNGQGAPEITATLRYGLLESNLNSKFSPVHNHAINVRGATGPQFSYAGGLTYGYTGQWQPGLFNRRTGLSLGMTSHQGNLVASGNVSITKQTNGTMPSTGANGWLYTPYFRNRMATGEFGYGRNPGDATFMSQRIANSFSQLISLNLDYHPMNVWHHQMTVGRSQNDFDVIPEAPVYMTPADTLFKTNSMHGGRTTFSYNMVVMPPPVGFASGTLTLGTTGSSGSQTAIGGCLSSQSATSTIGCYSYTQVSVSSLTDSKSWGGYGSLRIGLFDRLYLTAGLRGEQNPAYGRAHKIDWTPTNGIAYTIERGELSVKVLASYGQATTPPSPDMRRSVISVLYGYGVAQYYSQIEAENLRPQKEYGPQGGVEIYYGNNVSLTINHFKQTVRDLIQSVIVDTLKTTVLSSGDSYNFYQRQYVNISEIRKIGWEATTSVAVGPLTVKGAYSWSDSRIFKYGNQFFPEGFGFVNGTPTHWGSVTLGYMHGNTSVNFVTGLFGASLRSWGTTTQLTTAAYLESGVGKFLRHWYYGSRVLSMPEPARLEGYSKTDMMVSHRMNAAVTLNLNVMNIGNSFGSETSVSNPTLGRQSVFGVSVRFPRR